MASRAEIPTITRRRSVLACARCRARRVKCDRAQPACSNCSKAGALCQPASQKDSSSGASMGTRGGRLSQLEQGLARLSRELDSASPSREPSRSPSQEGGGDGRSQNLRGKILSGTETKYFSPFSWTAVAEELSDVEAVLGSDSAGNGPAMFSQSSSNQDPRLSLPDDHLHETLLNVFRTRVDPLVRVLHWPSFLENCRDFRRRMGSLPGAHPNSQYPAAGSYYPGAEFHAPQPEPYQALSVLPSRETPPQQSILAAASLEADFTGLLYSVYYAAIVSVIDAPNPPDLDSRVDVFSLLETFRREVSVRVLDHDTRSSIQALQAMVLALAVDPESFDVQSQSLQLSAAIHKARGLGVHRDGSNFKLSPIEIEVRRRIWAQLCILDIRYAEQLGKEPMIAPDSYDTALPLSIDDRDLTDIEAHEAAAKQGKEINFKTHQEIEYGQERQSPFSPMTFCLIGAENARLLARLLVVRYHARDAIVDKRPRRGSRSPSEKLNWVSRLDDRFQTVYGLGHVESTNPLQYLASEFASINVAKATFLTRMMEWKEDYGTLSEQRKTAETIRLFQEAVEISTRTLNLIHQYGRSQYGWYIKRLRDVHTATFLGINLASRKHVDEETARLGGSILTQLYPVDSTGRFIEHGLHQSVLGKVMLKAAATSMVLETTVHHHHGHHGHHGQRMPTIEGSEPSIFTASITTCASVSLPTTVTGACAYQAPFATNILNEFDTIMNDSLWPPGLSGTENAFSDWDTSPPQGSGQLARPSAQPQTYHQPTTAAIDAYPTPPLLSGHSPAASHASTATNSECVDQSTVPLFHGEHLQPNYMQVVNTSENFGPQDARVDPSRTWPLPQGELLVPTRGSRERSLSQPQQFDMLGPKSHKSPRAKSMTMSSKFTPSLMYATDLRTMSVSPQMLH